MLFWLRGSAEGPGELNVDLTVTSRAGPQVKPRRSVMDIDHFMHQNPVKRLYASFALNVMWHGRT
jgi:hypothetical protein